jgi:hypothetical protein
MKTNVYWNIRKKVYSLRQNGRVVNHDTFVALSNPTFNVAKAGQTKVRAEGRKNVHATLSGNLMTDNDLGDLPHGDDAEFATYNPYKNDTFVDQYSGEPVLSARFAQLIVVDGKRPLIAYWA